MLVGDEEVDRDLSLILGADARAWSIDHPRPSPLAQPSSSVGFHGAGERVGGSVRRRVIAGVRDHPAILVGGSLDVGPISHGGTSRQTRL